MTYESNDEILEQYEELDDDEEITIDLIAKSIVLGDNDRVRTMLDFLEVIDIRSPDDTFTSDDRSLIEIAVRANNLGAVEMLLSNYVHSTDISADSVIEGFLSVKPLRLAIELGHNEIANYLYECESQLIFPGDVSTLAAINMAINYKNDELVQSFISMFKFYNEEIVKRL